MATSFDALSPRDPQFGALQPLVDSVSTLGEVSLFALRTLTWLLTRLPRKETLLPNFYQIGVLSLPVVALTGTFIGMVLAVQSYSQFRNFNLETRLGAVINVSLVRELGPVLAATMLAGRVGSAMAAELGTMRVTEQIDALSSMGANPVHYLVVPRFLACLVLIPTLTIMADFMGVVGAAFYSIFILHIDPHHYWYNSQKFVGNYDLFTGVFKSLFFGAAIALISCHRGFHCQPGAEGVGRAATAAFVYSFVMILIIDLLLDISLDTLYFTIWPDTAKVFSSAKMVKQSAETTPILVELKDVHVSFGRQAVLRDINLAMPRGQTMAIIGESGCGKTVLLKTIIGLVKPTRGEMFFDGQNLAKLSEKEITKQRVRFGFLFQSAALFDSLTVGQNVAFPLREHTDKSKPEVAEIVLARLAEVGLPEAVADKKPAELSGGMRKRVGLARALTMNPELMLYDEPTTGLDPIMSDVINELIIRTRGRYPVTSIVVTHDMRTALKVADRLVMLYPLARLDSNEPQIIFDGLPDEVERCRDPRVTQFIRGEAGERLMEMRKLNGALHDK